MGTIANVDELLSRAFELAYFILGDRTIAIYVAMAAVDKLKIASIAQDRRLDYTPVGRITHPAIRTKITLSEAHLLQRLIYAESEPFERLLEGQRRSGQEDMIIRFVKHLVRITIKHNSFYLALGLSRLLYTYTTTEAAEIYEFLIQDPDRTKDDYYYRSRKQHLMREMKGRFAASVQTYRGYRGEERFQAQEDSAKHMALVQESLRRLTPWQSECVLPADFDPHKHIIRPLLFEGQDPDEEHQVELNRIHTILHPDCFGKLISNLELDAPTERLEIPQFFETGNDQGLPSDRFNPATLDEDEVLSVKRYLERNEGHRKIVTAESLSFLVDGDERARFNIHGAREIQFAIQKDAEFVELRSFESDEQIPLAIHPLSYDESGILPSAFSVMPVGGQSMDFEIHVEQSPSGETFGTLVCASPRDAEAIVFNQSPNRRFRLMDAMHATLTRWLPLPLFRFGPAILLSVIALVGSVAYFKYKSQSQNQVLVAEQREPDQEVTPSIVPPGKPSADESLPAPNGNGPRPPQNPGKATASNSKQGSDSTRTAEWVSDPAVLLTIKRVYVDPLGDSPLSRRVREALSTNLRSSKRFVVVENRDDADAVFKGAARESRESGGNASLVLRLVNAEGKVVWPLARQAAGRKYSGTAVNISDYVLKMLLGDIARLEHAR